MPGSSVHIVEEELGREGREGIVYNLPIVLLVRKNLWI
jgi:hypothetical protein